MTVAVAGPRFEQVNANEGTRADGQLSFIAQRVTVDNLSASWAFIPAAQRYVPPFTYGVTLPCISDTQNGGIKWETPPNLQASPRGSGSLSAVFTDSLIPLSQGVPVYSPGQQVLIGTLVIPAGTNVASSYAMPAGAYGFIVVAAGGTGVTQMRAVGGITGTEYANSLDVSGGVNKPYITGIMAAAVDTTLTVSMNGVVGAKCYVVACFTPTAFGIQAGGGTPINVHISDPNPVPIVTVPARQPVSVDNIPSVNVGNVVATQEIDVTGFTAVGQGTAIAAAITAISNPFGFSKMFGFSAVVDFTGATGDNYVQILLEGIQSGKKVVLFTDTWRSATGTVQRRNVAVSHTLAKLISRPLMFPTDSTFRFDVYDNAYTSSVAITGYFE